MLPNARVDIRTGGDAYVVACAGQRGGEGKQWVDETFERWTTTQDTHGAPPNTRL